MKYRATILVLILLPILVGGGFALTKRPMNAPVIAILAAVMIWLGYTGYARRIDQNVIQPDAKKATRRACTWTGWTSCRRAAMCSTATTSIHNAMLVTAP